jgi:serine/threonine protein kinase
MCVQGIVHRDLKTNNVFRCQAGDVLKLGAQLSLSQAGHALSLGDMLRHASG